MCVIDNYLIIQQLSRIHMHACNPNHISQVVMIFFFQKALRLYGYYKDAQFFCVFDQKKIKKKERKQIHEI